VVQEALVHGAQLLHVQGGVVHPLEGPGFGVVKEGEAAEGAEQVAVLHGERGLLQAEPLPKEAAVEHA